ncbi:UNKNOWN [Stylonychia lemnae]|uniref:Uncharacterized protein n=1 Tax=Stylonychia lemnae TaxID=5949 RepID=A0A077ZZ20_STYLE|nr:UNKNOWN [Stylonychia lemnae]|eukprot:CDW75201.1 UNKNOWN [Stylonychia lemnae]
MQFHKNQSLTKNLIKCHEKQNPGMIFKIEKVCSEDQSDAINKQQVRSGNLQHINGYVPSSSSGEACNRKLIKFNNNKQENLQQSQLQFEMFSETSKEASFNQNFKSQHE